MTSMEMNMMSVAMPTMQQGPVEVRVCCFEATSANVATLRKLREETANGAHVTVEALVQSGMKPMELKATLATTVKEIRADMERHGQNAPIGSEQHMNVFALSRKSNKTKEESLVPLTDDVTVNAMVESPQIGLQYAAEAAATEVCVGGAATTAASSAPALVLFYNRDNALGCSDCCLCVCCAAMCAAVCCCCCSDD